MNIYLMRHGIAEERTDPREEVDRERALTSKGRDHVEVIAKALRKLKVKPDLIVSSPYTRARETAEIIAREMKLKKRLVFSDILLPESKPDAIIQDIVQNYKVDDLLLIGHYPSLGWLLAAFLGVDPGDNLPLKKGGICRFTAENLQIQRTATLDWLLPPSILLKV